MSSSKPPSGESRLFQERNIECRNYHNNHILKQKSLVGTVQGYSTYLSLDCNSFAANAGNAHEQSMCESRFGGSFGHSEADSSFFGGNFSAAAFDDAQVVPDFNDVLEVAHVDLEKTTISYGPFVGDTANYANVRELQNSDLSGPKRRNSERDELEIYFPCVLTPIPVDRLYSTLDDSTVFKFPANSDEFLSDDKSKEGWTSKPHNSSFDSSFSKDNRHNLDSFANLSVLSFPGGSQGQVNALPNQLGQTSEILEHRDVSPHPWISSGKKDYDSAEGQNCFSVGDPPCNVKPQILPTSTTTSRNSFKFQEALRNTSCPQALSIVSEEDNCDPKVLTPPQSFHTMYNLPIQLNNTPAPQQYIELAPNLATNVDLSHHPFSLDGWESSGVFDNPTETLIVVKRGYREGDESFCERLVTSSFELASAELKSRILSGPERNSKMKPDRARKFLTYSNSGAVKIKAKGKKTRSYFNHSADHNTRTSESTKISDKSRSAASSYHENSRGFHNDMEKQRRINMKTRFQNLRMVVPDLLDNEKASKISILQKALECIGMLEKESAGLENLKRVERLRNIELLNKLQKITAGK